jgi:hypothetical protein
MAGKLTKLWSGFTEKHRLSITDSDNGSEKWYMYISPLRIVIGFVALILILFIAVIAIVAYTPVMDTIPGYPGSRSREMLVQSVIRLDSLEREMHNLTVYSDNIALIMDGKTPVIRDVSRIGDSIEIQDKTVIPPNAADSILRLQMEGAGAYSLSASVSANRTSRGMTDLVPPAQGLIRTRFNPVQGHFGVEVVTASNHPVVAIREGTVIMNTWTPEDGNIVQIQHPDNLVSVYRRVSQIQCNVGARVRAGEMIGIAGSVGEDGTTVTGPPEFELWYNGSPVDPENYIVF